jgi:hypothetical protein
LRTSATTLQYAATPRACSDNAVSVAPLAHGRANGGHQLRRTTAPFVAAALAEVEGRGLINKVCPS